MLRFRKRRGAKELPEDIKQVLRSRYRLYTPELFSMEYVENTTKREGKRVRHFEIFGITQSSYAEPEGRDNALLFEGRIEKDGSIDLIDRRPAHSVAR